MTINDITNLAGLGPARHDRAPAEKPSAPRPVTWLLDATPLDQLVTQGTFVQVATASLIIEAETRLVAAVTIATGWPHPLDWTVRGAACAAADPATRLSWPWALFSGAGGAASARVYEAALEAGIPVMPLAPVGVTPNPAWTRQPLTDLAVYLSLFGKLVDVGELADAAAGWQRRWNAVVAPRSGR